MAMKPASPFNLSTTAKLLVAATALSAATGAAFASWVGQADGIFMAMVDAGISWCF